MFIGPDAQSIECMGLKHKARQLAIAAQVPVVKGSGLLSTPEQAVEAAKAVGFPVRETFHSRNSEYRANE